MNYSFDIAAILILMVILFFYFKKKSIPSMQTRIYLMIVSSLTITSILEIITSLITNNHIHVPVTIQWILECLYYTGTNSFGIMFTMYCMGLINGLKNASKKKLALYKHLVLIPYVAAMLIIWLSPLFCDFYPLAFRIHEDIGYVRTYNIWFYLLYVISAYYIILGFIFVFANHDDVEKDKIGMLVAYVVAVAVSVFLQMKIYGLFIECFGITLAALMFFFYIQKPEDVTDSITETFNQVAFITMVDHHFTHKNKIACVAVILDDTVFMGNTIGINQMNNFLKEVGKYFKTRFSYYDIFCLNQECFCIIVKNPTSERVNTAISLIQRRFKKTWINNGVELKLYSRICVVECPKDAASSGDVIDIISMVSTDERYKRPVIFAKEIDLEYKRRSVYIEHTLRNGLTENRFQVYYQPIFSVSDARIIGAEALIRLKDEKGEFISPEDFIPIAEKTGTILRIGEFVFEDVCRTLSKINIAEYGIKKIDINLSVAQCMQEILSEQILAIQSIYQIPTEILNLEITETAAAHTPEILLRNMQRLSEAGFELSLDDYGSGYSNMGYMLNLPFKMIKIDKYIVWAAYKDKRAELALSATIKMIKEIGMTVLAEGVEEREMAHWLVKLGCDYLQGYYFSKPVPKNEFLEIMKNPSEVEM